MNYNEVLDYLFSMEKFGVKLGLDNITKFLSKLSNPHNSLNTVHIAGTNGKGSTVAIMDSILSAAGYRVGTYTSPHLVDFRERIKISGHFIDKKYVADFITDHLKKIEKYQLTYFEVVTALAFSYFRDEKVDIALIETGLGGRLDATNVLNPKVVVITNVATEHTKWLGFKIRQIANEKAGVIKPGVPVVTAAVNFDARKVIRKTCEEKKSNLISVFDETQWIIKDINRDCTEMDIFTRSSKYYNLRLQLAGRHQLENAVGALIATELLEDQTGIKVTPQSVAAGFRNIKWDGRLQRISDNPDIILDAAHNPAALGRIREYFSEFYENRKTITVFGILTDKDYKKMLEELDRIADVIILTRPMTDRAADPEVLAKEIPKDGFNINVIPMVREAYKSARELAEKDDIILVTGSHFTVGEVLAHLPK
jgi:dihydrofolate synthase/folylpolyglutamate synthase